MADQWEYKTLAAYTDNLYTQVSDLDKAGADGWELVSVIDDDGLPVFYLKRLVTDTNLYTSLPSTLLG